jgi:hypothetical protein
MIHQMIATNIYAGSEANTFVQRTDKQLYTFESERDDFINKYIYKVNEI